MRFDYQSHVLGLAAQADYIFNVDAAARDVALHAVHINVTVVDDLTCGKNRWREFCAVNDHVQTALKQANQVLTGIALKTGRIGVSAFELLLGHVTVIALELLLGAQLQAKVAHLALAALTMLARTIRTLVYGRIWTTPDVFTHPAIKFVLSASTLRHKSFLQFAGSPKWRSFNPASLRQTYCLTRLPLHRGAEPIASARISRIDLKVKG